MRPFFSYYGAKYTAAGKMTRPVYPVVVEPFAGSAAFSTRYGVERAILLDVSEDVCAIWDYLIHASVRDIAGLPDALESNEELARLPDGPRQLLGFWVSKGRAEVSRSLSPWYMQYRKARDCRVWGPAVKGRIIRQLPKIRNWRIIHGDYREAPDVEAHWHIDPPYNNPAGSRYPHSNIDYAKLREWVFTRKGFVQVCENEGAEWLPFEPLCHVTTSRGRRSGAVSREVVYEAYRVRDTETGGLLGV